MENRTGNDIRELFLRFFESKGHRRVHSSSLVPANDPTLLFTNAGMNQFKDLFLALEKREYSTATSSQKCVRAGGKHNDLENVGFTRRHHTFFEMLGNFSFGDYFKRDAIDYAWELITSPEWMGIPKDRLYVTIFEGDPANNVPRDDEAANYWIAAGVPKDRIHQYGLKDNFWQMGETGPCGPCSEIFYDMGIDAATTPGVDLPFGQDDARYVEIWNLVFMQFDRILVRKYCTDHGDLDDFALSCPKCDKELQEGVRSKSGFTAIYKLAPLPKPCVDTGMGLERAASVIQGKASNFETDIFTPLIVAAAELTGAAYDLQNASLRIIADHARAATFLISDGVLPSNEGRGYVLRKIMRRAIRHGRLIGQEKPFLCQMVYAVRDLMQGAYPELIDSAARVAKVVETEEKQFARVLSTAAAEMESALEKELARMADRFVQFCREYKASLKPGFQKLLNERFGPKFDASLDEYLAAFKDFFGDSVGTAHFNAIKAKADKELVFRGELAFHLYETYGLPLDFMQDAARDRGMDFDLEGFEAARNEEQARARASWKGGSQKSASPAFRDLAPTAFEGYRQLNSTNCQVLAIVSNGVGVPAAKAGEDVEVVLDHTSFYGDSGGQTGDTGFLLTPDGNATIAEVIGCTLPVQGVRAHKALLKQGIAVGDLVTTAVNAPRRDAIRRNHTGTHLLHAALREVLGTHVKQAGSAVHPDRLRFDFSHFTQVADEELEQIETIVNQQVLLNSRVDTLEDVPIDVAVNELGAMALFGEKYGDKVRVVKVAGGFSTELCGGTHTIATGEIGLIKVTAETSVSSGVRRIEAITGLGSLSAFRSNAEVAHIAAQVAGPASAEISLADSLRARLASHEDELKRLRRELEEMRMKSAAGGLDEAIAGAVEVKGVKLIRHRADQLDRGQLRTLVDNLRQKAGESVIVLASAQPEGKVAIIAGVTPGLVKRIQAGKLVGAVAKLVGGSGGGKPDIAEAGGKDQSQIDAALNAAPTILGELLG